MERLILLMITVLVVSDCAYAQILITDSSRVNDITRRGGWGPHLRSIFKDAQGSLWYADDRAIDANNNVAVRYHKLEESLMPRRWGPYEYNGVVQTNEHQGRFGRIQQNTAHISNGTFIYSYGIDVERNLLMQCYFRTTLIAGQPNPHLKNCNSVPNAGVVNSTNYVGAAISPSGKRIVWWTSVSPFPGGGGAPGQFFYKYHDGNGWSKTIATPVTIDGTNYASFSYVHMIFRDEQHVEFVGQAYTRTRENPTTVFSAVSGSIDLTSSDALNETNGSALFQLMDVSNTSTRRTISGRDIWYNPTDESYHALAYRNATGTIRYFFKPKGKDNWEHVSDFANRDQARFNATSGGLLNLVLGATRGRQSGIEVRSINTSIINGPIEWNHEVNSGVAVDYPFLPSTGALDSLDSLYVQSASYQTTPVDFIFAAVGRSTHPSTGRPSYGNNVWFYRK